jgi:hypothetical protein
MGEGKRYTRRLGKMMEMVYILIRIEVIRI